MVHVLLLSPKGNQGVHYFPHTGYLGLTPVKVEGAVRTKLDDDSKLIPSTSLTISIRCYESHITRLGVSNSNVIADYTQVLWSKPAHKLYDDVGNMNFPFTLEIPPSTPGCSTINFPEYRIHWRIEAALNHVPMIAIGHRKVKSYGLALVRYNLPAWQPRRTIPSSTLDSRAGGPNGLTLNYRMDMPVTPVGPSDVVSIPLSLQPVDPLATIQSATLVVERRTLLNRIKVSQTAVAFISASPNSDVPSSSNSSTTSFFSDSTFSPSMSVTEASSTTHLLPSDIPLKTVTTSIVEAQADGLSPDENGVWKKTLTFQWPEARSHARWALGETLKTESASVRFFVRVKLTVSSHSGTESIDLAEQEIVVVSRNESERKSALSSSKKPRVNIPCKAKTTRRRKRDPHLPSSPASPGSSLCTSPIAPPKPVSSPRRQQKSSGPRREDASDANFKDLIERRSEHRSSLIPITNSAKPDAAPTQDQNEVRGVSSAAKRRNNSPSPVLRHRSPNASSPSDISDKSSDGERLHVGTVQGPPGHACESERKRLQTSPSPRREGIWNLLGI